MRIGHSILSILLMFSKISARGIRAKVSETTRMAEAIGLWRITPLRGFFDTEIECAMCTVGPLPKDRPNLFDQRMKEKKG